MLQLKAVLMGLSPCPDRLSPQTIKFFFDLLSKYFYLFWQKSHPSSTAEVWSVRVRMCACVCVPIVTNVVGHTIGEAPRSFPKFAIALGLTLKLQIHLAPPKKNLKICVVYWTPLTLASETLGSSVRGTVLYITEDNLAAPSLGWFLDSFVCDKICRFCMVARQAMQDKEVSSGHSCIRTKKIIISSFWKFSKIPD